MCLLLLFLLVLSSPSLLLFAQRQENHPFGEKKIAVFRENVSLDMRLFPGPENQ